jgi:ribonuclease HI
MLKALQNTKGTRTTGAGGGGEGLFAVSEEIILFTFAWGLGKVSNNIVEAYALWKGVNLVREKGIQKITILGDSLLVIRALIKRHAVGNNVIINIIACTLSLLNEFEIHSMFHIKREHNSLVDHWAKVGSNLAKGDIIVNGIKVSQPIP